MTNRPAADNPPDRRLQRVVGLPGAMLLGLGSIVGTGVFVSIGVAAEIAGSAVVAAIFLAALVATCNGLSSAQLAARHAVSGGTYEYGYEYLGPWAGFTAGWLFLCAKSASAATAALGFIAYFLLPLAGDPYTPPATLADQQRWFTVATVVVMTIVVFLGLRRSNWLNALLVGVVMATLAAFVWIGLPQVFVGSPVDALLSPERLLGGRGWGPLAAAVGFDNPRAALEACALMFVAFTGYGRIATMGEEIREPRRNIPRAIIAVLAVSTVLYLAVAATYLAVRERYWPADVDPAFQTLAPSVSLLMAAESLTQISHYQYDWLPPLIMAGAAAAMLGVLLNLILGLSRVVLAMARRGDLPRPLARIDRWRSSPQAAIALVGVVIAGLTLIGDVKLTWSFSAFTVLLYYGLTNLCALRMRAEDRLYPRWLAVAGLAACVFLAFWVEWRVWLAGLGVIAAGWVLRAAMQAFNRRRPDPASTPS